MTQNSFSNKTEE